MPFGGLLIGGMASTIGGSLIGSAASAADRDAARAAAQKAVDIITSQGLPPDLSKQVFLEQFQNAGILTPEMEQEINVQYEKIKSPDQKTIAAQQQALQGLAQASKGGLTAEERVAQTQIANRQARENEAAKNSIMQNLAQRGQLGSGSELALRLQSAQGGANEAAESSDRAAAAAQARALQALGSLGNLSSQMRGQEFGENQANTGIANEQNRFNVSNQIAQQARNVGAKNQAQASNLTNAQNIMNANVGMGNQEKLRQKTAERQYWQDVASQNQAKANAYLGESTQHQKEADATQGMWSGIGAGIGTGLGQIGQYSQNQDLMNRMYPKKTPQVATLAGHNLNFGPSSNPDEYAANLNNGYYQGGEVESDYFKGGKIPGEEIVPGDSPLNDVVHARLESGEYVVPKEDAPSMELIHHILKGMKKK